MINFSTFSDDRGVSSCYAVYRTHTTIELSSDSQKIKLKGKVCKECLCSEKSPELTRFAPTLPDPGASHDVSALSYVKRECGPCPVPPPLGCICELPDGAEKCVDFDGWVDENGYQELDNDRGVLQDIVNLSKDAVRTAVRGLRKCV